MAAARIGPAGEVTRLLCGGLVFLAVVAVALTFRLSGLSDRPMHGDEAIQAYKTAELWEKGYAKYDPEGYHGPALHYLTLPFLWLSGAEKFSGTVERDFRQVPALFGAALVVLVWALSDGLGFGAASVGALLLAVSPSLVFYSRYYVQETILVFFTIAAVVAGWRHVRSGRRSWIYYAAIYVGLMFATKETAVIALGSMFVALWLIRRPGKAGALWSSARSLGGPVAVAGGVALLCLSTFLVNPRGAMDILRSPIHYVGLAFGGGIHDHPWHYYLGTLLFSRPESGGPWWTESVIVVFGVAGMVAAFRGRHIPATGLGLARFLAWSTLLMIIVYSIIPYKTPWCMLSFTAGLAILSGVGVMSVIRSIASTGVRWAVVGTLVCVAAHLAWQAYRASFVYSSDRRNPYVYAHPSPDVKRLGKRVERLAGLHADGMAMPVQVVAPDPWPLPWYLRRLERVGYWTTPPARIDAPVVIMEVATGERVRRRLAATHSEHHYGLRPPVVLVAHVENGLWEKFLRPDAKR